MGTTVMILGESGTGKSASMRNLDPTEVLLIQPVRKPLPFRAAGWRRYGPDVKDANIFQTDDARKIVAALQRTQRKIVVIDDFQYIMANEFMRRTNETGFSKFTEIGKNAWDILNAANDLPEDVRVYIMSHVETADDGRTKIKTIGRMLDEKITLEGMVTIVLRTVVRDGQYLFATRNNGSDTTKTPMGLFDAELIDNDLAQVDQAIQGYYLETA